MSCDNRKDSEAEWLFPAVDPREFRARLLWECSRELPYIAKSIGGKKERIAIEKKLKAIAGPEFARYFPGNYQAIYALLSAGVIEYKGTKPWEELIPDEREDLTTLLWPRALLVDCITNENVLQGLLMRIRGEWECLEKQPRVGVHKDPRAGFICIRLTPYTWTSTKENLINEFKAILDKEEWAPIPEKMRWTESKRGLSEANIRKFQDQLGVARLIHRHSYGQVQQIISKLFKTNVSFCDKNETGKGPTVFKQLVRSDGTIAAAGVWLRHRNKFLAQFSRIFKTAPACFNAFDGSWPTRQRNKRGKA